jgi:protein O-GlcNAc transferase
MSNFDAAVGELRSALQLSPDDSTIHYNLGLALKLKDQIPAAITEFEKAAALDPKQADIHYTLGVTLWQQGDFPKAVSELKAAIQNKPDYAEAHYTLGTVLKQQGNLQEAATELREAIRLQPDFAGAHTTLASILRQLGDTEGAAKESQAGASISKEKTSLQAAAFNTNSGKRMLNAGDLEGAIAQFRSAIERSPQYAPAHLQLSAALKRKGESVESEKEWRKAVELDPRLKSAKP